MKTYAKNNFHKHTFCLWQEVSFSEIEHLIIQYKSKSGSSYIFLEHGVYRISDHWGRAANCRWRLIPLEKYKNQQKKVGFAKWTDFYPNNENEKLFFIQVDFDANEINFHHKFSPLYEQKFMLRNAFETSKRIQIIKEVLNEIAWSRYLRFENIEDFRKKLVNELLTNEKSFIEIKKQFM
jgi:hypothetical protein